MSWADLNGLNGCLDDVDCHPRRPTTHHAFIGSQNYFSDHFEQKFITCVAWNVNYWLRIVDLISAQAPGPDQSQVGSQLLNL